MRIPRLFIDMKLVSGETVCLPREKAHHILHVLRMRVGDSIKLFNDSGYEFNSKIIALTKNSADLEIDDSSHSDNESPLNITLCLAIARGTHMDFSIQKAVELGVDSIIPVISEFSNVRLKQDRIKNKMEHWQNIIISASEQCGRNRLTKLIEPITFNECVASKIPPIRLILHPGSSQSMSTIEVEENEFSMIIGPEGGFSDKELNEAESKGCRLINMGPRILRTETAVVCALSNAQYLWGDLN